jgi:hypothetical protein
MALRIGSGEPESDGAETGGVKAVNVPLRRHISWRHLPLQGRITPALWAYATARNEVP